MQPIRQRFFSRQAKYAGSKVEDLELNIKYFGEDVVRIELQNRLHGSQCSSQVKRLLLLASFAFIYFAIVGLNIKSFSIWIPIVIYPALFCAILVFYTIHKIMRLVRIERLFYSWDLALQTETIRTFGSSVFCIERANIHDIVINEVIEDLDIKYMVILRTRGRLFANRPIIPLFNTFSPSIECLQAIHQRLHSCWLNTKSDRSENAYSKEKQSTEES